MRATTIATRKVSTKRAAKPARPKKKHQVHAPDFKKIPDEERKNLDVWGENDGWCSACRREYVRVVHIGSQKRLINVALCGECLSRMTQSLGAA